MSDTSGSNPEGNSHIPSEKKRESTSTTPEGTSDKPKKEASPTYQERKRLLDDIYTDQVNRD